MSAFDLHGRVAVVTGAGQGVGAGIARALGAQGAMVVVNDRHHGRAMATVETVTQAGGQAMAAPFDVSDADAVAEALGRAVDAVGPVDILVNNAGKGGQHGIGQALFRASGPEHWDGPLAVDLRGVLHCTRAVINGMCDRGWGRIVSVASDAGAIGMPIGVSAYGAAKGAVIALMRHVAVENAGFGVTANAIALGLMEIADPPPSRLSLADRIPVGRMGRPSDVGSLCAYLASDEAAWMTGQTIHLNGGEVTS